MNTNIPTQTNPAYEGGRPVTAEYQDGYGPQQQQAPYANEMQEKRPLHHVTQGEAFQGPHPQDAQDPSGFRDNAGYRDNATPDVNAFESQQRPISPKQTNMSLRSEKATLGHGAEPVPAGYQQDAYGNQQDTYGNQHDTYGNQHNPYGNQQNTYGNQQDVYGSQQDAYGNQQQAPHANELPAKPPVHPSRQGGPFQGSQFNHPAATGVEPEQNHVNAGTDRNAPDATQVPPNYDGHTGAMYEDQRYPNENAQAGGPAVNQGQPGSYAADTGFGGNRNATAGGNFTGDQRTTTGNTGTSWRTDPVGKFNTYLSHPSVAPTVNQIFSGGPFAKNQQTSLEPTTREAKHLKMSGKMEEMAGKMLGSESMQRRGQEKVLMGRNMAVQVQDLKQAGKLEGKATKLRAKGGGVGGGTTEEYAGVPPAEQGMGPSVQGDKAFRRY